MRTCIRQQKSCVFHNLTFVMLRVAIRFVAAHATHTHTHTHTHATLTKTEATCAT